MFKRCMRLLVGSVALMVCLGLMKSSAAEDPKTQRLDKTTTNDMSTYYTINNIFNMYYNNGRSSYNKFTSNNAFEVPKGSGKFAIFEDGVVWGGFHKGRLDPKVGGSTYAQGLQAGKIITPGGPAESQRAVADDPTLAKYRVYRARPDVSPTTPFSAVQTKLQDESTLISRYEALSAQTLYNNYVKDWNEWPANEGVAPYTDVNKNGRYDPTTDIPGQPGADQTLYYVANDLNATAVASVAGSPPIGLEMHRTVWGYNLSGALGNTVFASTLIINKSGAPLDSAFFVQWSDPDLGTSEDDYAGCDVGRSLGYVYNGKPTDGVYGSACPAVGYDFFQGPIIPGAPTDSAVFQLKYRKGYRNLGMSTFVFFINSNATYSDPNLGAGGDVQWYRLMNAKISSSGADFVNPNTKEPTKYTLDGDPVTGQGWLDGTGGFIPGDRRVCLVTGPFTLANGDTQEVVVASLAGFGADRISSVNVLKYYSDLAQSAYNNLFNIPRPPPSPKVTISELEGEIVLTWPDSAGGVKIESFNSQGYAFEGYNIFQYRGSSIEPSQAIRLATYDKVDAITTIFDNVYDQGTGYVISKPVQFGGDGGIKRVYQTTTDVANSRPLVNGSPYYFGVTSYAFNSSPTATPTQLESAADLLTIVPQWADPGTRLSNAYGDTLKSIVHTGPSDGLAVPVVLDPKGMKAEGATYNITFQGSVPNQTWTLKRTWKGVTETLVSGVTDQAGTDPGSPVIDGIQWKVIGAPLSFKDFAVVANATGPLVPPEAATINSDAYGYPHPSNSGTPVGTRQQSAGKLTASKGWTIATGMNSTTMSPQYTQFISRVTQGGARWPLIIPYDWEIRFTAAGSKAWNAYTDETPLDVPFELWNIGINTPNNTADDYRLFPYILDVDGNGKFNLLAKAGTDTVDNGGGGSTHSVSGGANDPFTDWIYWLQPKDKSPGQAGYNAIAAEVAAGTHAYLSATTTDEIEPLRRMVIVGWNMGAVATGPGSYMMTMPEAGTTFRIISTKPNQPTDVFTITAPAGTQNSTLAAEDANRVNVYPNPYIGYSTLEKDKYSRFITFSHLPVKATIRIFNLAGVLVRTLVKENNDQFFQWDLRNTTGFPVGAGMFIAYVDMPDVGVTKVLKFGVILEQQFIDRW